MFDFEKKPDNNRLRSLITTNYDIYHNVIGFRLLKTTIRTPPYNINKTNNIIRYKSSLTGETVHKITITPGQYEVGQLADVFQKYYERIKKITTTSDLPDGLDVALNYSQYVTYSDKTLITERGNNINLHKF